MHAAYERGREHGGWQPLVDFGTVNFKFLTEQKEGVRTKIKKHLNTNTHGPPQPLKRSTSFLFLLFFLVLSAFCFISFRTCYFTAYRPL